MFFYFDFTKIFFSLAYQTLFIKLLGTREYVKYEILDKGCFLFVIFKQHLSSL